MYILICAQAVHQKVFKNKTFPSLMCCMTFMQVAALTSVLELARASPSAAFQPKLFSAALQIMICSRHASADILAALNTTYLQYIDIRYLSFTPPRARTYSTMTADSCGLQNTTKHL